MTEELHLTEDVRNSLDMIWVKISNMTTAGRCWPSCAAAELLLDRPFSPPLVSERMRSELGAHLNDFPSYVHLILKSIKTRVWNLRLPKSYRV